jgi:hypothetical protein
MSRALALAAALAALAAGAADAKPTRHQRAVADALAYAERHPATTPTASAAGRGTAAGGSTTSRSAHLQRAHRRRGPLLALALSRARPGPDERRAGGRVTRLLTIHHPDAVSDPYPIDTVDGDRPGSLLEAVRGRVRRARRRRRR